MIGPDTLLSLPLGAIDRVTFFKRDEITTDLICCEIVIGGEHWTFHEELAGWELLLQHIQRLPGFRADWFSAVSQAPFARCEAVAFQRQGPDA